MKKFCIGIVFGGKSSEHEISLLSAKNIITAIDKNLFEIMLFGVDKNGIWQVYPTDSYLINSEDPKTISLSCNGIPIAFIPNSTDTMIINLSTQSILPKPDLFLPIIHGNQGEDGSLQGFLNILGVPFVGSDVLSSAICMDKDICKRLLEYAGIKTTPFMTVIQSDNINYDEAVIKLGKSLFVKPASEGSSIGVSKVSNQKEFVNAIELAFKYGKKVIIESAITGKEIECAVLGSTENPKVSMCGEVKSGANFYSYDAKYIDEGSTIIIPAILEQNRQDKIREIAKKAYKILGCNSLARVDFFVTEDDIIINEINTLPGFTNISMYPKLWQSTGINYTDLITFLIESALNNE